MIDAIKYAPATQFKYNRLEKGSVDWEEYWEQELDRCMNGYKPTGGTWIPGQYYFYLNYCKVDVYNDDAGRRQRNNPYYRDQDHEYFLEIDQAKKGGYGLIVLKSRRKGFSVMNANGVMLHEYCFYPDSENGIGAQMEKYVNDFRGRLLKSYHELPTELRPAQLKNNEELLMSGYTEKMEDGTWVELGMKSQIHFRVMERPDAFRGTALTFMIFEEAGQFLQLKTAYQANEECFKDGIHQYGVPIIGGTSNQMNIESEDFQTMYYNAGDFNLKPLFFPATKCLPGYFDFTKGVSKVEEAEKHIKAVQKEKKEGSDISNYFSFCQEMPLTPEEAFVSAGQSPFDLESINRRIALLRSSKKEQAPLKKGRLSWTRDKDGKEIFGSNPVWEFDNGEKDPENPNVDLFPFYTVEDPLYGFRNADVAAIDPYHVSDELDEIVRSKTAKDVKKSRSKGAMCVYRNFVGMDKPGEMPVAFYVDRPKKKEKFYENCLKMCMYYNCKVLVENNDEPLLKYFVDKGFSRYLKERPRSVDSPTSKAINKWGINMKGYQKKILTELVDEYINKHIDDIFFLPLLKEFTFYGKKNTDWVMAFGMALIHSMDTSKVINESEEESGESLFGTSYSLNSKGNVDVDKGESKTRTFTSFSDYGDDW